MLSEQVSEKHGAMINGEQVNDPIEEDDHTDNLVEDDGTNFRQAVVVFSTLAVVGFGRI